MNSLLMVKGERFSMGGPGVFMLGKAEEITCSLFDEYEGKIRLICIDPPFGTGDSFSVKLSGSKKKVTVPVYNDDLSNKAYMDMMRSVLTACHRLLAEDGSIYLHIDYRMSAKLRFLMDEIFGESNFVNEIIWSYKSGGRSLKHYSRKHDTILFYRKSTKVYFDIKAVGIPRGPQKRNNMKRTVDEQGRVCFSIRSGGKTYTYYEDTPIYPSDVWDDIEHLHQRDPERTGFATQKPEALLKRMILASSKPGDIVADFFSGSGTTAAVATAHGRQFIAGDYSPVAMAMLRRRQLANHAKASMLKEDHALTIEYGAPASVEPTVDSSIEYDAALHEVTVSSSDNELPICYAALGTVDESGYFSPEAYYSGLMSGFKLSAAKADILQLCDIAGNVRYMALK